MDRIQSSLKQRVVVMLHLKEQEKVDYPKETSNFVRLNPIDSKTSLSF